MISQPVSAASESPESGVIQGSGKGTLEFLLRRMRLKSDFPALSDSVTRINRLANSDTENLGHLTNEILKDVALTNKLLRLVNSAHFARAGGQVSTVSRAVALIGYNSIRNLALSLVLLEHMDDKEHADRLKEEFLRCLLAGTLAGQFCVNAREREEAYLTAMFQNLGRLLTEYYFPDEARTIRDLTSSGQTDEQAASARVLGMSFDDLGLGVAQVWGLPETLQRSMRRPLGQPPSRAVQQPQERLRWLALAANDITDTLLIHEPQDALTGLASLSARYAHALGVDTETLQQATATAREHLREMADAMRVYVAPQARAQRLFAPPPPAEVPTSPEPAMASNEIDIEELHATMATTPTSAPMAGQTTELLVAGIQDITNAMVEDASLNQVVRMVLETMLRSLGLRRIVFCLLDAKASVLTGRFGLGKDTEKSVAAMRIALKATPDLFNLVCSRGVDTLISDASEPHIAHRLPQWYRDSIDAPCFLLMPMQIKGSTFALIYGDSAIRGEIAIDEKQLTLLRTLRNQAIMAFRQAGAN